MSLIVSILRRSFWAVAGFGALYAVGLGALTNPSLQRHALYAHKFHTAYVQDLNKPEQWGFAYNQITPFNLTTPDNETLYAWHVMPLGLYAKHETEIIEEPQGLAEDITKTKAFDLLATDPHSRLIISFHGNAGTVAQGWRPDIYRSLSDGSTSTIHILAVDYRGFGYSSGSPTEAGLVIDGIATVNWALNVAKMPADRIVIVGHSLGTAVTAATVEHFANQGVNFAGVIVIAPFTDLPTMLTRYSLAGLLPLLSPIELITGYKTWFPNAIVDKWNSVTRIANIARVSKRLRLFIIHARNDWDIPYTNSDLLFAAAANAATPGVDNDAFEEMKARNTLHMGDGTSISTWRAPGRFIREIIVPHGGHNQVMTFPSVALAALKAFEIDGEEVS